MKKEPPLQQLFYSITTLCLYFNIRFLFTNHIFSRYKGQLLFLALISCSVYSMAQPSISSFTPTKASPGKTVTIDGSNFNTTAASNIVFFGATTATVTQASATQLKVTVPSGATYGPITVLNTATNLVAYSTQNFLPVYSPSGATITTADMSTPQTFATGAAIPATSPTSTVIGDIDGDGKPDVAVANHDGNNISVFLNTSTSGTVNFSAHTDFAVGTSPNSITIGDIDGDGKLDLATANPNGTVSVFRNTSTSGSISFDTRQDFTAGSTTYWVAIGDMDGDGKPDLVTANQFNIGSVSVLLNTGSSGTISFATKQDFTAGVASSATNPNSIAIGDIDGDGKRDLVMSYNGYNANISVLRNTSSSGSLSFATNQFFSVGILTTNSPYSVIIGDIDGDGKLDLATAHDSYIYVLRNTSTSGSLSFASGQNFATIGYNTRPIFADIDGNGKPDVVTANTGSSISILRNTSTSGTIDFATKADFVIGSDYSPVAVAAGDLDGDGQPDLAIADYGNNSVSILRNQLDGTVLPLRLLSFTGKAIAESNLLQWQTADEVNFEKFGIERSANGNNFSTIGFVIGGKSYYQFTDNDGLQAATQYYRLKLSDIDGRFSYSKTIAIKRNTNNEVRIYPVPVRNELNLLNAKGNAELYNSKGELVLRHAIADNGPATIDLQKFPSGMYVLKLWKPSGELVVKKITKE